MTHIWEGARLNLLQEYFENKVELYRIKNKLYKNDEDYADIKYYEERIKFFINILTKEELRSVLLMAIDIE